MRSKKRSIAGRWIGQREYSVANSTVTLVSLFLLASFATSHSASDFACTRGEMVSADLGDGVIMRTCMVAMEANTSVRTGPLELVKNGVLILRLETDANGKLHGRYTTWDDTGEMTESGIYQNGIKEGEWIIVNSNGERKEIHYRAGNVVEP